MWDAKNLHRYIALELVASYTSLPAIYAAPNLVLVVEQEALEIHWHLPLLCLFSWAPLPSINQDVARGRIP